MPDPKFVRLADHMSDSVLADVTGGSGWSLSGRDVKPFPEGDEAAARFVRSRLVQGLLEAAGAAEHDEVQASNERLAALAPTAPADSGRMPMQEAAIQEEARRASERMARVRAGIEEDNEDDDDEDELDIDALDNDELNSELAVRDLSRSGNMEVRRARLREAVEG